MIRRTVGSLVVFALLAVPSCLAQMQSHYSSYANITGTQDSSGNPKNATVTMTLEGYTYWNCCYPPAKHTGNVQVTFGGVSNSNTTGQVNPNYNMNISTSVTLDATDSCFASDLGCVITADDADVICTMSGRFTQGTVDSPT